MKEFLEVQAGSSANLDLELNSPVAGFTAIQNFLELKDAVTGIELSFSPSCKKPAQTFDHVISTAPLPVVRTLDIDGAGMDLEQLNALRTLKYGPACKIGVKFKSQWWAEGGVNIRGGQSVTDRPSRVVVYPSYGIDLGDPNPSHVLIASYTWTADALRFSALIAAGKKEEEKLKSIVLRDLAAVHKVPYEMLLAQYIDHFPWDWNANRYSQGWFQCRERTRSQISN